jgi:hypothetical protein
MKWTLPVWIFPLAFAQGTISLNAGAACEEILPLEAKVFDLDEDGTTDVRYLQDIGVIANDFPPSRRAVRYIVATAPTRVLRSQGTKGHFRKPSFLNG